MRQDAEIGIKTQPCEAEGLLALGGHNGHSGHICSHLGKIAFKTHEVLAAVYQ